MGLILPAGMKVGDGPKGWDRVHNPGEPPDSQTFMNRTRGLLAIRAREIGRWHLSVSHRERVPTWGELGYARDALLPADVWMMVAHPPRKYWLNYHTHVLHLWEFRDAEMIALFREEGEEAQRMGYGTPDEGIAP